MKYNVRFFVIILITFCITIAKANDFSSIVYINMDKVMKKSAAGKSLIEQLEKIHLSNIAEFKKIEDSLKSEESSIMSQKNILSDLYNNKLDMIVCNPPYIPINEMDDIPMDAWNARKELENK